MKTNPESLRKLAVAVLETEARAVQALVSRVDDKFVRACDIMLSRPGRVVVTGMGKSGHIARKIAATLSSVGSPAFFMHPGEASHGDLGMITRDDTLLALSNSGNTVEILTIVPLVKRLAVPLITLTGDPTSRLASEADVNIDVSVSEEACPLGLAPTASTTAALAMGDALAIALLDARGFSSDDFALSHPGGRLGRRLLLRVRDLMHTDEHLPQVSSDATMSQALMEMTEKSLGMTGITDQEGRVLGVFTDGDLRRAVDGEADLRNAVISNLMTKDCITVEQNILAAQCLSVMEQHKISGLLVVDENQRLVGALNMHDLLRAGVL